MKFNHLSLWNISIFENKDFVPQNLFSQTNIYVKCKIKSIKLFSTLDISLLDLKLFGYDMIGVLSVALF